MAQAGKGHGTTPALCHCHLSAVQSRVGGKGGGEDEDEKGRVRGMDGAVTSEVGG